MRKEKPKNVPHSLIEKWLIYERGYDKQWLAKWWGVSGEKLRDGFLYPWKFFTFDRMYDVARMCDKELPEVFFACQRTARFARDEDELMLKIKMNNLGL